jgi:paraquat-inducible protein A
VLFCFSILFPLAKNLLMLALLHGVSAARRRIRGVMHALSILGKWSMLDVFIVAILVCSVKLGLLADTEVLAGVYCFAASVLLTNIVSTWLDMRLKASDQG